MEVHLNRPSALKSFCKLLGVLHKCGEAVTMEAIPAVAAAITDTSRKTRPGAVEVRHEPGFFFHSPLLFINLFF